MRFGFVGLRLSLIDCLVGLGFYGRLRAVTRLLDAVGGCLAGLFGGCFNLSHGHARERHRENQCQQFVHNTALASL
jgi:hypothetical protein